MKRLVSILIVSLVLILLTKPTASAQPATPIQYGMLFRAGDSLNVAVLTDSGEWQVQTIPTILLFGQYDAMLQVPEWTEDGHIIGVGYDPTQQFETEPIYVSPAAYIYRYDTRSQTLSTHPQPIATNNDPDSTWPELLAVTSLSPHADYVTAFDVFSGHGFLIQTDTGKSLVERDSCGLKAFAWDGDLVYLGSNHAIIVCEQPAFFTYNLATHQISADQSAEFEDTPITVFDNAYQIDTDDWLFEAYGDPVYYQVAYLNADGLQFSTPLQLYSLQISESKQSAAFVQGDSSLVVYVDLTTGQQTTIPLDMQWGFEMAFDGETLRYLEVNTADPAHQTLTLHSFLPNTDDSPIELVLNDNTWSDIAISPNLDWIATQTEDTVRLYDTSNSTLIWKSSPDLNSQPSLDRFDWSDNLLEITSDHSILVDVATGETIQPPEPTARFISTSPDGAWLLYRVIADNSASSAPDRLIVMNRITREAVVLSDGDSLYDNSHFDFRNYFIWSPQLD